MNMDISLNAEIGCFITDLNAVKASAEEFSAIKKLLYKHKIVILKDQNMLEQQFCDLAVALGEPIPYLQENYHHPDYPLIFVSSNVEQNGEKFGVARTGGYWHSDTSFLDYPVALTMLYPQIIPVNSRRTTLFIDLEKALDEMPTELKRCLDNRYLIQRGKWKYKVREEDVGLDMSEIMMLIHQVQPPVSHPAVIRHPATGNKTLFASRGFTIGIDGMGTDEANTLLESLFDFIEQDRFISEFQWQLGDIIIWDNRFLAHKAGRLAENNDPVSGDINKEEDTLVYRIIIRDGLPLGNK